MTLHSAKGLEFPVVYMVGLEEGILPHHRVLKANDDDQIDEERRLAYVGVTRAQERLTLSLCLGRTKWGKVRETLPSRFLFEMMGQAERAADVAKKARKIEFGQPTAKKAATKKKAAAKKPAANTKPGERS
jgi:DNA helicase-2/ATP-dependent DNA helicase PcrA